MGEDRVDTRLLARSIDVIDVMPRKLSGGMSAMPLPFKRSMPVSRAQAPERISVPPGGWGRR
jgi:hypothetical protein